MRRHLILAQSKCTAAALEAWAGLIGVENEQRDGAELITIIWEGTAAAQDSRVYLTLVQRISDFLNAHGHPGNEEAVFLVDSVRPEKLNPIQESTDWDNLIALLILTFPEARWHFGVVDGSPSDELEGLRDFIEGVSRDPLLDPTGLRDLVRKGIPAVLSDRDSGGSAYHVPTRARLAASIDNEEEYALLHAYCAYRYGYRADVVSTYEMMKARFGLKKHDYDVLFEDMRLSFPDKPSGVHLSYLGAWDRIRGKGRAKYFESLAVENDQSQRRFLVTTGDPRHQSELMAVNQDYLDLKAHGEGVVHEKPLGGICDLWTRTHLRSDLKRLGGGRRGNAPGFVWPPAGCAETEAEGHSAPGKLEMAARVMISRARMIAREATTLRQWLVAAVLSGDAAELLNGRTPTMTLSAIALKHECEVWAECMFIGTGFHFGVRDRVAELDDEIAAVAVWYSKNRQDATRANAMAQVLNRLVLAFRDSGRVEEEDECLVPLRYMNWRLNSPGWNVSRWPIWWITGYGSWLLGGLGRQIIMMFLSVLLLAGAAHTLRGRPSPSLLSEDDLSNPRAWAESLKTVPRTIDWWMFEQLSGETKSALGRYEIGSEISETLRTKLLEAGNRVIVSQSVIFEKDRFTAVHLRDSTLRLLADRSHKPSVTYQANRQLLEDAYTNVLNIVDGAFDPMRISGIPGSTSKAITWFFGGSGFEEESDAPSGGSPQWVTAILHGASWLAVALGLFHASILTSFFYAKISRK